MAGHLTPWQDGGCYAAHGALCDALKGGHGSSAVFVHTDDVYRMLSSTLELACD